MHESIRKRFGPAWKAHDHLHGASPTFFEAFRNGQWRVYTLDAEAQRLFDTVYDRHTADQERSHLVDLNESRFHSKAKTKHLRHSLAVHVAEESRQGHDGEAWCCRVSARALRFGELLSDHMDRVDSRVHQFLHELLDRAAKGSSGPAAAAPPSHGGKSRVRDQLAQLLGSTGAHFETLSSELRTGLLALVRRLLMVKSAWIESSVMMRDRGIKTAMATLPLQHQNLQTYCLALRLIALWQLGASGLGTQMHGTPIVWLIKRRLRPTEDAYGHYVNVLTVLGFRVADYCATAHDDDGVVLPSTAPALTLPPPLTPETVPAALQLARGLVADLS